MVVGGSTRRREEREMMGISVLPVPRVVYFVFGTEKSVENLCSGREDIKGCKTIIVIDSLGTDLQQLSVLVSRLIPGPGII